MKCTIHACHFPSFKLVHRLRGRSALGDCLGALGHGMLGNSSERAILTTPQNSMRVFDVGEHFMLADVSRDHYTSFDVGDHVSLGIHLPRGLKYRCLYNIGGNPPIHIHMRRVCADKKQTHHNRPELPETSLL